MTHPAFIGPYRIESVLGQGGMGVVYRARQTDPIERTVALKVLLAGRVDEEVLGRFEAERQVLARMAHPSIANVYDAGLTEEGAPYFAMEFIDGLPIGEYCDRDKLSIADRLRLFTAVCRAVGHGHQRGIIHRDLKPTNILVTEVDGEALPKVIDFGIARATDVGDEDVRLTRGDQILGTPAYMSPEQVRGDLDIDTRTDVYGLGMVLYEVMVGVLPLEEDRYRGWQGMAAVLAEEAPTLPVRFDTLADTQVTVAKARSTDPPAMRRALMGEVEWIVAKALEKEPDDRYQSVFDLAEDIDGHLEHRPILAGPPTAAYRMRKFVRRNRVGVGAAVAVAMGLIAGTTAATIGLVRAQRAEAEAVEARAAEAVETATATRVADFMVGIFENANPSATAGRQLSARDVLDEGATRIHGEIGESPMVRARLLKSLSDAYAGLGEHARTSEMLDSAIAVLDRSPDSDPALLRDLLQTRGYLNRVSQTADRDPGADFERAWAVADAAWDMGEPEWHASWFSYLEHLSREAGGDTVLAEIEGRIAEAENALDPESEAWGSMLGAAVHHDPAWNTSDPEAHARPERWAEMAIEVYEGLGDDEAAYRVRASLITQRFNSGRAEDAAAGWDVQLEAAPSVVEGEELANDYYVAGFNYESIGRTEDAVLRYRQAIDTHIAATSPVDPGLQSYYYALGNLFQEVGRWEEAVEVWETYVAALDAVYEPGQLLRQTYRGRLAAALAEVGRRDDARRVLVERLAGAHAFLAREDSEDTRGRLRTAAVDLAALHLRQDGAVDPRALRDPLPELDLRTDADLDHALGNALSDAGRSDEAIASWRLALDKRRRALGPDHPTVGSMYFNIGLGETYVGRDPRTNLRRAKTIFEGAYGRTSQRVLGAVDVLRIDAHRRGDAATELALSRQALEIQAGAFGPRSWRTADRHQSLGLVAIRAGALGEAEIALDDAAAIWADYDAPAKMIFNDFGRARLAWAQGRSDEALTRLRDVEARSRESEPGAAAMAACTEGEWLSAAGRSREAQAAYDRATEFYATASGDVYDVWGFSGPIDRIPLRCRESA